MPLLLDVDASAEDNRYAAKVAGFSLTKVGNHSSNGDLVREVMCGLTTDVDGWGRKKGIAKEIDDLNWCCDVCEFMIITYAHHSMPWEI